MRMEFGLTDEERMIRDMAARYAGHEAASRAAQLDEAEMFDRGAFAGLAELGFPALPWPESAGGAGGGFGGLVLALHELARVNASLAAALWAHVYLAAWPLMKFGATGEKRSYADALLAGSMLGTGVLPGAVDGASRLRIGVTAAHEGEAYVLEGEQKYVIGGAQADLFVVYAEMNGMKGQSGKAGRSERWENVGLVEWWERSEWAGMAGSSGSSGSSGGSGRRERKRYSVFLVERDCPGLTVQPVTRKLGLRSAGMAHLTFRACHVPVSQRLGREGQGNAIAKSAAAGVRCGLAAVASGIARGAADAALGYAKARSQFGKPIAKHQAIAFLLADLETAADAAQLLVQQAAWRVDAGLADDGKSALALSFAADAAMASSIQAVQVYGGYGYMKDYPVERYMRDAKIIQMFKALDLTAPQRRARKGSGRD